MTVSISEIFLRKKVFHQDRSRLPIEEKVKILIELQKIAIAIHPQSGSNAKRTVWKI